MKFHFNQRMVVFEAYENNFPDSSYECSQTFFLDWNIFQISSFHAF